MVTRAHVVKEHTGRPQVALKMCIHAQMCVGVSTVYVGRRGWSSEWQGVTPGEKLSRQRAEDRLP